MVQLSQWRYWSVAPFLLCADRYWLDLPISYQCVELYYSRHLFQFSVILVLCESSSHHISCDCHLCHVPFLPVTPTILRKEKMAAVHFTTIRIPCEPNTVCRVQGKPHFCSICSCAIEIVYAEFEVLERSCTFFERFLRFRARRIMSKYTNILHIRLSLLQQSFARFISTLLSDGLPTKPCLRISILLFISKL